MADFHEIERLIAAHINAYAEHDRLFALNDQGLVPDQAVQDALDPLNETVIALCAARPVDPKAAQRRAEYLNAKLWDAVEGCDGLVKAVLSALIDATGEVAS